MNKWGLFILNAAENESDAVRRRLGLKIRVVQVDLDDTKDQAGCQGGVERKGD